MATPVNNAPQAPLPPTTRRSARKRTAWRNAIAAASSISASSASIPSCSAASRRR